MKSQNALFKLAKMATVAVAISSVASPVWAGKSNARTDTFTAYGTVINAQPVYRQIQVREPRQECWTEQVQQIVGYQSNGSQNYRQPHRHSAGSTIVGGIIGGVIGNQLGRGHRGRAGATVAGAIIGSAIGSEANSGGNRHRRYGSRHQSSRTPIYETRDVERCKRVVDSRTENQLQHYNVTYQYKGRQFVTRYPRDPGNKIELQVSIDPIRR